MLVHTGASEEYLVRVSYLEIYNEEVRDLLAKAPHALDVKEDPQGGIAVRGLAQFVVKSVADIASVLRVRSTTTGVQCPADSFLQSLTSIGSIRPVRSDSHFARK